MDMMKAKFFGRVRWCVVGLLAVAGCYSQSDVYRAVPNVGVTRPNDVGSQGPLVLVTVSNYPTTKGSAKRPDVSTTIDRLTLNQIAQMDRGMAEDLRELQEAHVLLDQLKAQYPPTDERVTDAEESVRIAQKRVDIYAADWRELKKKLATAESPDFGSTSDLNNPFETGAIADNGPALKQTVLMINQKKKWGNYDSSFGQTVVLILDGPVKPGQYWLTPSNSVLIRYSSATPPARTRVGLAGSVKVLSVEGDKIVADVSVRQTFDTDSGDFMATYYDPTVWQMPWVISGKHTFVVTKTNDPAFDQAQVRWITD
jgi:hypothetical protein